MEEMKKSERLLLWKPHPSRWKTHAGLEPKSKQSTSKLRWFITAAGLSLAIAFDGSSPAFSRVNVEPGGTVDGGTNADPETPMSADPRLDAASAEAGVWQHAHGSSANAGFSRVDTGPAASHRPFTNLGPIAPGANPVVGPNGDVYIGNLQGELRAFHADGTPYWTRKLNSGHGGIFAAPVVGADGSIYVVSSIHYTDHRGGVTNERNDSFLHKFSPGGGWVFALPFPEQFSALPSVVNRGASNAPPNSLISGVGTGSKRSSCLLYISTQRTAEMFS